MEMYIGELLSLTRCRTKTLSQGTVRKYVLYDKSQPIHSNRSHAKFHFKLLSLTIIFSSFPRSELCFSSSEGDGKERVFFFNLTSGLLEDVIWNIQYSIHGGSALPSLISNNLHRINILLNDTVNSPQAILVVSCYYFSSTTSDTAKHHFKGVLDCFIKKSCFSVVN